MNPLRKQNLTLSGENTKSNFMGKKENINAIVEQHHIISKSYPFQTQNSFVLLKITTDIVSSFTWSSNHKKQIVMCLLGQIFWYINTYFIDLDTEYQ